MAPPTGPDFYDAELRAHHEHLRAAYGISPGDEVLDIGCGTGLTTREAARAAAPGRVVGVDVSERMLERARQVTAAERLGNVRYVLGDAQVHRFDPAGLDVAIRRFGTMFFSDPAAAFANIAAALRPEARLVLLVWQRLEDNEWARAIDAALGDAAQPPPPGADPFSLGDRRSHRARSRAPARNARGALQRRARRGPRFALLVDQRPATPLRKLTMRAKAPGRLVRPVPLRPAEASVWPT